MAKYINNKIKSGRLAGSVFAVRYGETIERAYNPYVANPNTPAQIATRAKFKLLSQLAAVLAPVIAIPRAGSVSSRNVFTALNFGAVNYETDEATIDFASVKLTKSVVGIPTVVWEHEGNVNTLHLASSAAGSWDKVVYIVLQRGADESLRLRESHVVSQAGADGTFSQVIDSGLAQDLIIYAYGMRLNTSAARVVFGDITAPSAEQVVSLLVQSKLLESDVTLSETVSTVTPA